MAAVHGTCGYTCPVLTPFTWTAFPSYDIAGLCGHVPASGCSLSVDVLLVSAQGAQRHPSDSAKMPLPPRSHLWLPQSQCPVLCWATSEPPWLSFALHHSLLPNLCLYWTVSSASNVPYEASSKGSEPCMLREWMNTNLMRDSVHSSNKSSSSMHHV